LPPRRRAKASLSDRSSSGHSRPVWRLPSATAIGDGALLFTDDGLFAGALVVRGGERTLVAPDTLTEVGRILAASEPTTRGLPGIAVQELTPQVASAVGADRGMIVAWVDPEGPAAGLLQPLDVIDGLWGQPLVSLDQWEAELDRLRAGSTLDLRVRRAGSESWTVTITAAAPAKPEVPAPLGLTLRLRRGSGAEVVRVDRGSAAEHAGLLPGDIITVLDAQAAPTPAQVTRAYAGAEEDRPIALAVTRGAAHLVLALEKRW
jgi:serine protease Do